jgi:hypothetical protein
LFERFSALAVQVALSHPVREVLDGVRSPTAALVGAYAWEQALRLAPPCTVMQLATSVLEKRVPIRVLPWDGPVPGPNPEGEGLSPLPLPPKQTAQAALGGAVLAFARLRSTEELLGDSGARRLREGALAGVEQLVKEELGRTRGAEKTLAQVLDAFPRTSRLESAD